MYLRWILWPLSILFGLITQVRFQLYRLGVLKRHPLPIASIVVGNIRMGGTGKTPMIHFLQQHLSSTYVTAILSRGYKRKTSGYLEVQTHTPFLDSGDEPLLLKLKNPHIAVAVCENRLTGTLTLHRNNPQLQVLLMDDAFQHFRVRAACYVLTTAYHDVFTKDTLFPMGMLREHPSAAKRADVIVVTKTPDSATDLMKQSIKDRIKAYSPAPVVFSSIQYGLPVELTTHQAVTDGLVSFQNVTLVTGIADPKPLIQYLEMNGLEVKPILFPDHHPFTKQQITDILKQSRQSQRVVLCTEKDMVKWSASWIGSEDRVYYLPIEQVMPPYDMEKLFEVIQHHMSTFAQ
jgi:tetraacyldisaccharide 4'-kinase